MTAEDSALAALGLRRGAARAEVDAAYRRLMKLHHPDRTGGDGRRAAEINQAYTFLSRDYPSHLARARRAALVSWPQRRRSSRGPWVLVLVAAVATGLVVSAKAPLSSSGGSRSVSVKWVKPDRQAFSRATAPVSSFDEPLHADVIGAAIADAMAFHSAGDGGGAAEYSRDCHIRLRQQPNLALFDACAAFDESTLVIRAGGPLEDSRAFNGSAVTARVIAAARAISDDSLGADARLHRIRSRVEIALLSGFDDAGGPVAP